MCLLACLLEMWGNSECYDRMTRRVKRKRDWKRSVEYKMERWRAAKVRHKWVKRELEHRKDTQYMKHTALPTEDYPITQQVMSHIKTDIYMDDYTDEDSEFKENAMVAVHSKSNESDGNLSPYLSEDKLMLFLQNEEFIAELQSNPEFLHCVQDNLESYHPDDRVIFNAQELKKIILSKGRSSQKIFARIAHKFSLKQHGRAKIPGLKSKNDNLLSHDELSQEYKDNSLNSLRRGR